MFVYRRSSLSCPGSHSQACLDSSSGAGTVGNLLGVRRRCRSHTPGAVKLPPPSQLQPACGGDREQRGPGSQWQPGSAAQPPITERLTHLSGSSAAQARWGAGPCSRQCPEKRARVRDLDSADALGVCPPAGKELGSSLPPTKDEEESFPFWQLVPVFALDLRCMPWGVLTPTASFLVYLQGKEKDKILRRLLGTPVWALHPNFTVELWRCLFPNAFLHSPRNGKEPIS